MSKYEWMRSQVESLDEATRTDVLALISVWEQFGFTAEDPRRDRVLDIFSDLARGVALDTDSPDSAWEWVPAVKAKPRQKDRVRVKRDAFTGELGVALNGKEGIVARISRGTLVVAIDNEGSLHVHPEKLEARVPKRPV